MNCTSGTNPVGVIGVQVELTTPWVNQTLLLLQK